MKVILFDIKKFKSFIGNEGHGFNAELWMDGQKAAFVIDDASGGEYQWEWYTKAQEDKYNSYVKALPKEQIEPDAEAWEKKMYPDGREISNECFMALIVDAHETLKRIKSKAAKATLFTVPSSKKGEYFAIKLPFSPETKLRVLANPKNAGAKFINEHLIDGGWMEMIGLKPLPVPA